MLYHSEILVGMFVVLGCLYFADIGALAAVVRIENQQPLLLLVQAVVPMTLTIFLALGTNYEIHRVSIVILTFIANSVFRLIQWILGTALPFLVCRGRDEPQQVALSRRLWKLRLFIAGLFALVAVGLQAWAKTSLQEALSIATWISVYLLAICSVVAVVQSTRRKNGEPNRQELHFLAFGSTLLLVFPFLVAGKLVAILSKHDDILLTSETTNTLGTIYSPSSGLYNLMMRLLLPVGIKLVWLHFFDARTRYDKTWVNRIQSTRSVIIALAVAWYGPSLFRMGQGYRGGDLLATVSWMECVVLLVQVCI
jgi:hypothetical protein